MITQISEYLIFLFPEIKRFLMKRWYQHLAREFKLSEWSFMNYGYAHLNGEPSVTLDKADEANRLHIQLYDHVAAPVDLWGKDVLEVGSGRGGGCYYMARYLKPGRLVGVDFSQNAVELCNRLFQEPNLSFRHGDAEALPFPDESFDVVINIESSHCYRSVSNFMREVVRILRPGGIFSWADLRWHYEAAAVDRIFHESGLREIMHQDITANVVHALDLIHEAKLKMIQANSPKYIWKLMREFTGAKGTKVYNAFCKRKKVYLFKVLKKP